MSPATRSYRMRVDVCHWVGVVLGAFRVVATAIVATNRTAVVLYATSPWSQMCGNDTPMNKFGRLVE